MTRPPHSEPDGRDPEESHPEESHREESRPEGSGPDGGDSPRTDQLDLSGGGNFPTRRSDFHATPMPPRTGQDGTPPPSGRDEGLRSPEERRAAAVAILDEPIDDSELADRIRRPGLARSTRILLAVLAAVVLLALGALIGRVTAPDTGPGSLPDVLGIVESVSSDTGGFPQITVRTGDGGLTVLQTTSGTRVAVPRPEGLGALRVGQQVTVSGERNGVGTLTATRVDLPLGR
jgi:hypothetical protein